MLGPCSNCVSTYPVLHGLSSNKGGLSSLETLRRELEDMNNYRDVFRNRHTILPVIHVESQAQTLRNTEVAREAGSDGAFLINHGMSPDQLLDIFAAVYAANSDWWLGVNCLGLLPEDVFNAVPSEVVGIWVDNAEIDERACDQERGEEIVSGRTVSGWRGLYFGGVAFKGQRHVGDLAVAARTASRYMDVVTTSGPGTGQAAHRDKIVTMKKAIGDFPLAIASGISPDNVGDYLDVADCFLVATGISESFTELDPTLVKELVKRVRFRDLY